MHAGANMARGLCPVCAPANLLFQFEEDGVVVKSTGSARRKAKRARKEQLERDREEGDKLWKEEKARLQPKVAATTSTSCNLNHAHGARCRDRADNDDDDDDDSFDNFDEIHQHDQENSDNSDKAKERKVRREPRRVNHRARVMLTGMAMRHARARTLLRRNETNVCSGAPTFGSPTTATCTVRLPAA